MLIIRAAQMEVLKAAALKRFEESVQAYLEGTLPAEVKALKLELPGVRTLRDLIRHGIARAAAYGLVAERDVARFIELMVRVDPAFENRRDMSWATSLLRNASLSPHARIELVHELLPRKVPGAVSSAGKPTDEVP